MCFQNILRRLLTGLALLQAGPAAAQEYYEFLPDTMGARLLRQAHVQHLLWTVEDLRYQSHSPYREYTFDAQGRTLTSRYSNGPITYTHSYDATGQVAEISNIPSPPAPVGQPATATPNAEVTAGPKSAF